MIFSKKEKKARVSILVTRYSARCWRKCNKESRCNDLMELKEEVKLSLFAGNMIIYVGNMKNMPLI